MINFEQLSPWLTSGIFLVAAAIVWIAGTRLSALADDLAEQTGLGRAFIGLLLLGGITSLPEVATTVSAAVSNHPEIAVSNVLGGVSMQVTILAVVDVWVKKKPLAATSTNLGIIVQAGMLIAMLAVTAIVMQVEFFQIYHVGFSTVLILVFFFISLLLAKKYDLVQWLSYRNESHDTLKEHIDLLNKRLNDFGKQEQQSHSQISAGKYLKKHGWKLLLLSGIIIVAGYLIVNASEVLAKKVGISNSMAGLVLVAITTSLPEISTTIGAIKLKKYDLALSNVFGTNLFDVMLLFVGDLFFLEGPILANAGKFEIISALMGILVSIAFIAGVITRSQRKVVGFGINSILVIIFYLSGLFLLSTL